MKRQEFSALSIAMQVRVLAMVTLDGTPLASIPAPKKPLPPRYDSKLFRQGGFQWISETSLEGLNYWAARSREGVARGSANKFAANDAKRLQELERWITWREWYPESAWSGIRNKQPTTASAPADRPTVHKSERSVRKASVDEESGDFASSADYASDDDDVAFG